MSILKKLKEMQINNFHGALEGIELGRINAATVVSGVELDREGAEEVVRKELCEAVAQQLCESGKSIVGRRKLNLMTGNEEHSVDLYVLTHDDLVKLINNVRREKTDCVSMQKNEII